MAEISKQALQVANNTDFPNNSTGYITPAILRSFNTDVIDSTVNQTVYTADSASFKSSITQLNAFTASQQPSFTALNAFTASQLTINSGYNAATQSLSASIAPLQPQIDALENWTSSVNQIIEDNVSKGYATRFNFGGLISASITANVNGAIADISVNSDTTKLNTSSFNDYTASASASGSALSSSQAIWNASATASIVQLLNFSSSLDATYATDAELAAVSSSLNNNINTKLNTSSFDSYTNSNDSKWTTIGSLTGSYATTGSNSFNGNQIITGSLLISSSATNDLIISGNVVMGGFATPSITLSGSTGLGQMSVGAAAVSYTSGSTASGTTTGMVAAFAKQILSNYIPLGGFISISGNPAQTGTPSLASVTSPSILGQAPGAGQFYPAISLQPSASYTDGTVSVLKPLYVSSSLNVTGSLTITGSAYGNVISASVASNTASIDLSAANYFTLTLASAGSTRINVINPQPGVTATLVINTNSGDLTASFSSNVKQPSGSIYVPSVSGNIDILSFTAVTTSSVYVVPAYTFV